jgi:hypothetical protein
VRKRKKTREIDESSQVGKRKSGSRDTHAPRATIQKIEKKEVAGGASWKLLKRKVQICKRGCKREVLAGCKDCDGMRRAGGGGAGVVRRRRVICAPGTKHTISEFTIVLR